MVAPTLAAWPLTEVTARASPLASASLLRTLPLAVRTLSSETDAASALATGATFTTGSAAPAMETVRVDSTVTGVETGAVVEATGVPVVAT